MEKCNQQTFEFCFLSFVGGFRKWWKMSGVSVGIFWANMQSKPNYPCFWAKNAGVSKKQTQSKPIRGAIGDTVLSIRRVDLGLNERNQRDIELERPCTFEWAGYNDGDWITTKFAFIGR